MELMTTFVVFGVLGCDGIAAECKAPGVRQVGAEAGILDASYQSSTVVVHEALATVH